MNYVVIQHFLKEDETADMMKPHNIKYIQKQINEGKIVLTGPFIDEKRGGMFVLDVESEVELNEITNNDPAVVAGILHNEI